MYTLTEIVHDYPCTILYLGSESEFLNIISEQTSSLPDADTIEFICFDSVSEMLRMLADPEHTFSKPNIYVYGLLTYLHRIGDGTNDSITRHLNALNSTVVSLKFGDV